ncbi:GlcNAc-PI de-N-acetylase [Candidatus Denitrolinea symbiosum]|jgi:LmbE family N-acetylglucosaminyl deacetylase|nr:GlcNAc-PI de-N-acetylase [Candidatus Denitrolinea symbiosum]
MAASIASLHYLSGKINLWFNQDMRWIYISPHLDDAVLSAGGLIYDQARRGERVEIWTLVCGFPPEGELTPFAQVLHFMWGFSSAEETVRLRRAEDERAAAIVGAQAVHFDGFLDCIYRRNGDGDPLYPTEVFAPPHPADDELAAKMTAALASRLQPDDVALCPLTVGHHVDHVLVRRAAEGLNRPLTYYADVPYVLNHPEELAPLMDGGRMEVQEVSSEGVEAWNRGVAAYASQISTLFESPEAMRSSLEAYARAGVRLWRFGQSDFLESRMKS